MSFARCRLFLLSIFAALATTPIVNAQEPDSGDVTRCVVAYYAIEQYADQVLVDQAGNWENLDQINLSERRANLGQQLGFASGASAESLAQLEANRIGKALIVGPTGRVLATVARMANCGVLFGFEPAIRPASENASWMVQRQISVAQAAPEEIVACTRAYAAGMSSLEAKKSPVAQLWTGSQEADFVARDYMLSFQADVVGAFSNIPAAEANKEETEIWKGQLSAALQAQDTEAQNRFWREVAHCDALIEFPDPVMPGQFIDPPLSHFDCASTYSVLRVLYGKDANAARYFQERGINAARLIRLTGSNKPDQALFAEIAANSDALFKTVMMDGGQPDFRRIAQMFDQAATCDRQYGLSLTKLPDDIRRRAREQ